MNQRGGIFIYSILFVLMLLVVGVALLFSRTDFKLQSNSIYQSIYSENSSNPTPSLSSSISKSIEKDTSRNSTEPYFLSCNEQLTSIPNSINSFLSAEFIDLSENNLSVFPDEVNNLRQLKELNLVLNNFNVEEQERIRKLLPQTKVAFTPQKNFDPFFKEDLWKSYTNDDLGISFRYHPELRITENISNAGLKEIHIGNELADFKYAYMSCSVEEAFISMNIYIDNNVENISPIGLIEKLWKIKLIEKGDEYVAEDKLKAQMSMFGYAKKYKNGDIEGVIVDGGESEHPRVISSHKGKFYVFQFLPGGETGSRIGDMAKQTLHQTLATFKFTK